MQYLSKFFVFSLILIIFNSCDFFLGSKEDEQIDEIFEQGSIDPELNPQNVGYVAILPVWGGFSNPVDVFVGYDGMVYVIDDRGLNVLDQKGKKHNTIPIFKATDVIQDRRIHTFVAGKVIKEIDGHNRELAAIYHLSKTGTANPVFLDTLIHPFCDLSRSNYPFRSSDLDVEFSGLAIWADNTLLVARRGKENNLTKPYRTDNNILFFNAKGENIGYAKGLNPLSSSLKSCVGVSSIATTIAPPQKVFGFNEKRNFMLAQTTKDIELEYRVLSIKEYVDPDSGVEYGENSDMLNFDYSKANKFLYESYRFKSPTDIFIAPDKTGYIFVVDSETNFFYLFSPAGFEGVYPPATSSSQKQIVVSFGGKGNAPFQFNEPSGVCYYKKVVYIADKGNNRIIRYKLNTDLE